MCENPNCVYCKTPAIDREVLRLRGELAHVTHSLLLVSACAIILFVLALVGWLT